MVNSDTQTSPGIGALPDAFGALGGCIIDVVGESGTRVTAQISAASMFKGWTSPAAWTVVGSTSFDGASVVAALGAGITKANIRISLYDGDSGSPNPVYVAMFPGGFPYIRSTPQPDDYDFDGGDNLYFGFSDVDGNPVNCGSMGAATTYRLDAAEATYDTFTGFPGCYALTDLTQTAARPSHYMTPVQAGQPDGVWPATGWFTVPDESLAALYAVLATGTVHVGFHDISPGDQYVDFTLGLAADVINIPFTPPNAAHTWLDLWVWRQLTQFVDREQTLAFPPGYYKALLYSLALEMFNEYPAAALRYDFKELTADVDAAMQELELLHASNAAAKEPQA